LVFQGKMSLFACAVAVLLTAIAAFPVCCTGLLPSWSLAAFTALCCAVSTPWVDCCLLFQNIIIIVIIIAIIIVIKNNFILTCYH